MKALFVLAVCVLASSSGCIAPDYKRLVSENKDAHIEVRSIYGTVIIDTRVQGSNNPMPLTR